MIKLLNILVDDRPISVVSGQTIMQTCALSGVEIPRFCYHDKLLIAGNCRICLVEVVGSKKLVASCAVHAADGISIYTNTTRVRLARQNVLEFLLANHPLDCPICDQGGECDLQDITAVFGADRGRFYEHEKRAVMNKDFGPLIRTSMNRCIHCTRCVRFLSQVSGASSLGTIGRGSSTEIGLYVGKFLYDALSGNVTDLCPVGALTSKPYSFKVRPWELASIESLDILDSLNSTITVDIAVNKICRVLPYANESLNEEWITNKARYSYDGLFMQRINTCLLKTSFFSVFNLILRNSEVNSMEFFVRISLNAAYCIFTDKLFSNDVKFFNSTVGNLVDMETVNSAKGFSSSLGSTNHSYFDICRSLASDFSFLFLFNTSLDLLSKVPSFCLLLAANTRFEAPLLNLKLTKLSLDFSIPFYSVGLGINYSAFHVNNLSSSLHTFFDICEFKHPFCKNFYLEGFLSYPMILIGSAICSRVNANSFVSASISFCYGLLYLSSGLDKLNSMSFNLSTISPFVFKFFGFLHLYSGAINSLDLAYIPGVLDFDSSSFVFKNLYNKINSLTYAIGCDNSFFTQYYSNFSSSPWLVYQGSHGNALANFANLVLPVSVNVERSGSYKNVVGFVQKTSLVLNSSFGVGTDSDLLRGCLNYIFNKKFGSFFYFNYTSSLRYYVNFMKNHSFFFNNAIFYNTNSSALRVYSTKIKNDFIKFSMVFRLILLYAGCEALVEFVLMEPICLKKNRLSPSTTFGMFLKEPVNPLVPNYYGDTTNTVVLSSKVMNLCSNIFLKKNFNFSTYYI